MNINFGFETEKKRTNVKTSNETFNFFKSFLLQNLDIIFGSHTFRNSTNCAYL